jgi:hypothetical protein
MPGRHRPIDDGRDGAIDGVALGEQPGGLTQFVVDHDKDDIRRFRRMYSM